MTDIVQFTLAVLGLLVIPGPTNTLMAASGAAVGVRLSLHLIIGALGGYLIAVTVWIELVGVAATTQPWIGVTAQLTAAAFLFLSAWKLWTNADRSNGKSASVSLGQVFLTTLINPKALVLAFAIFPQNGFSDRLPHLGILGGLVVVTAFGWQVFGAVAARSSRGLLSVVRVERASALALAALATLLLVHAA